MKPIAKLKQLHGVELETPLKTLADTTKRRAYRLDTQSMGKPDYDWAQVEEFRTKIDEENIRKLRSQSQEESEKEKIMTNLKRPGEYSSENLKVAYFGMTNDVRGELSKADRAKLIDIANKTGMNAVVTPSVANPSPKVAKKIIDYQIEYGQKALDSNMIVIPTLNLTKTTPNWVDGVIGSIEESYTQEEVPIVATDGFYPLKNASEFFTLRDETDRLIMVSSCRRKIYHDQYGEDEELEKVSAEVLVTSMGADIVGQYFHVGGFSPDEEDKSVKEMEMDLMRGNSMVYEEVTLEDADVVSCNCLVHEHMDDDQAIRYFGSQNKLMAAEGIHNEMRVPTAVLNLREYLRNDRFREFRNQFDNLDDALRVAES